MKKKRLKPGNKVECKKQVSWKTGGPTVTNGGELWSVREKENHKHNVFEIRCRWRMNWTIRMDKNSFDVMRQGVKKCSAKNFEESWQVQSMSEEPRTKRMCELHPEGRRDRERPCLRWLNRVDN